eukprot:6923458-Prymnesium_polylepis.1
MLPVEMEWSNAPVITSYSIGVVGRKDDEVADRRRTKKNSVHVEGSCGDRMVEHVRDHIVHTYRVGVEGRKDNNVAHRRSAKNLLVIVRLPVGTDVSTAMAVGSEGGVGGSTGGIGEKALSRVASARRELSGCKECGVADACFGNGRGPPPKDGGPVSHRWSQE